MWNLNQFKQQFNSLVNPCRCGSKPELTTVMNTHIYGEDAYKIICSCGIQTISKVPGRDGTAVECVMALLALWNSHVGVTLDPPNKIDCTASEEV